MLQFDSAISPFCGATTLRKQNYVGAQRRRDTNQLVTSGAHRFLVVAFVATVHPGHRRAGNRLIERKLEQYIVHDVLFAALRRRVRRCSARAGPRKQRFS